MLSLAVVFVFLDEKGDSEWVEERRKGIIEGRVSKWFMRWRSEWMNKKMNERMNECVNEWMNKLNNEKIK